MVSFSPAARASACSATRQRSNIGARAQLERAFEQLHRHLDQVFISVRADQAADPTRARLPMIVDSVTGEGPIVGIRSAFAAHPNVAWLVLACDLPFLSEAAIEGLLRRRDPGALATAYISAHDGLPEPLCAIWEPAAAHPLAEYQAAGGICPRKFLIRHGAHLLDLPDRARPRQRQYSRGILPGSCCSGNLSSHATQNSVLRFDARAGRALRRDAGNLGGDPGRSLRRTRRALWLLAVARAIEGGGQQRVQRLVAQARRQ